jgi:RHS repeat-associated protein
VQVADESDSAPEPIQAPAIVLPKGGGAVQGIGETFTPNLQSGTASLSVPIAVSPCRGFEPRLSLVYGSGDGNGPFGLGWSLDVPSISRRTERGLPRYADSRDSDTFVLSGAEDLVPALKLEGASWARDRQFRNGYTVDRYRPRVESGFALIERWRRETDGDVYWRSITRDNITSTYGRTPASRITDPDDPRRVFEWLLDESRDDRGNVCAYEYKAEDAVNVPRTTYDRGRLAKGTFAARYLKRISYGNDTPGVAGTFLFQVVFDYGDHNQPNPAPTEDQPWPSRQDPFSTNRPGFEVRDYRLCRRVLLFHLIPELNAAPTLVRSTDLAYNENPTASYLTSVTQAGYGPDPLTPSGPFQRKTLPPLELGYTQLAAPQVHRLDDRSLDLLPATPRGRPPLFVDLDGEGLTGVLAEEPPAWIYSRNAGGRFDARETVHSLPASDRLESGATLLPLAGDGKQSLVRLGHAPFGSQERDLDRPSGWGAFHPFRHAPTFDTADPNLRFIDLDGDGLADILVTEDHAMRWHESLGADGFGRGHRVSKPPSGDDDGGPAVVFADNTQTLFTADMTGDGLQDLVRIRNGSVCYWPNLGYGHFGPKVVMAGAPRFDAPDQFDPRRIKLADIDGSGTADILYVGRDTRFWLNQSGNGFADGVPLLGVPALADPNDAQVVDLLGTGTACLVWTSPRPPANGKPAFCIDLAGGVKPHLLQSVKNNLGRETRVEYTPSTRFYVADREAGRPWATRLPFPVQVVTRITTTDALSQDQLTQRFAYHHGYYDGVEREFRGFGMVEQWDAEAWSSDADRDLTAPPAHTKTWFHTGAFFGRRSLARAFASEYWPGDPVAPTLPDAAMPAELSPRELRESCRALRGQVLRTELYGQDGTPSAGIPYQVTERALAIRQIQPVTDNRYGVYFASEAESVTLAYERNANDPRVEHAVTLAIDDFGNPTKSRHTADARRVPVEPEQGRALSVYVERDVANLVTTADTWRLGLPLETRRYEGTDATGRLFARARTVYCDADGATPLATGTPEPHALIHHVERLAIVDTTASTSAAFWAGKLTPALLTEGGYLTDPSTSAAWAPSSSARYSRAAFYQIAQVTDPFGNLTTLTWDRHALLPLTSVDALGNTTTVANDYRVLKPSLVTDPNGNQTAAAFDALGVVVATAVMGKPGAGDGDVLPTVANPTAATTLFDYNLGAPTVVHTRAREQHQLGTTRWQDTYEYFDGFGRSLQKKGSVAPDPADSSARPRWVGTGRTVFDNKGNPVKKYEPFFSPTSLFESDDAVAAAGVCVVLHYDPLGRLIRTTNPDTTYRTVTFDAWTQTAADEDDNVHGTQWLTAHMAPTASKADALAAQVATTLSATPTVTTVDALGRPFLVTALLEDRTTHVPTRTTLDIQGSPVSVTDPRGVVIQTQDFDLLKRPVHTVSGDAGESWAFYDVAGKPLRHWDARGIVTRPTYDVLRRPLALYVTPPGASETLAESTTYGETVPAAAAQNLLGRVYQTTDAAGTVTSAPYDFKGNLLQSARQTRAGESFTTQTTFDALNRVTTTITPDGSVTIPTYDPAGLIQSISVNLRGAPTPTPLVVAATYNARRQRLTCQFGNGAHTAWTYDSETFRLIDLTTTRSTDGATLQDLHYTYDAVGNIVEIDDAAQPTIYFSNSVVTPNAQYQYDALYRLVQATGREHAGQNAAQDQTLIPAAIAPSPTDGGAMRLYTERYQYDLAGNITSLAHRVTVGASWTRAYAYAATSNRLRATSADHDPPGVTSAGYTHDPTGNITQMPSLPNLGWDFKNRLTSAALGVATGSGTATYQYDPSGTRIRKLITAPSGATTERLYLGPYEVYRERAPDGALTLERQSLSITDGTSRIALIETKTVDGTPVATPSPLQRYQFANHLGSALLELDQNARIISYEEFHPYGTTAYYATNGDTEVPSKRYRYTGKERDDETGLEYHQARYYAPWLTRWVSADPAGTPDGTNRFSYVSNRPIGMSDPLGKFGVPSGVEISSGLNAGQAAAGAVLLPAMAKEIASGVEDLVSAYHAEAQREISWAYTNAFSAAKSIYANAVSAATTVREWGAQVLSMMTPTSQPTSLPTTEPSSLPTSQPSSTSQPTSTSQPSTLPSGGGGAPPASQPSSAPASQPMFDVAPSVSGGFDVVNGQALGSLNLPVSWNKSISWPEPDLDHPTHEWDLLSQPGIAASLGVTLPHAYGTQPYYALSLGGSGGVNAGELKFLDGPNQPGWDLQLPVGVGWMMQFLPSPSANQPSTSPAITFSEGFLAEYHMDAHWSLELGTTFSQNWAYDQSGNNVSLGLNAYAGFIFHSTNQYLPSP